MPIYFVMARLKDKYLRDIERDAMECGTAIDFDLYEPAVKFFFVKAKNEKQAIAIVKKKFEKYTWGEDVKDFKLFARPMFEDEYIEFEGDIFYIKPNTPLFKKYLYLAF